MMKTIIGCLSLCLLSFFISSCEKEGDAPGMASLNLVNAVPGSNGLLLNFKTEGHTVYKNTAQLFYTSHLRTAINANDGTQRLRMFQMPDTTDKDQPLFDLQLNLPLASMQTLFLAGSLDAPDTMLIKEDQLPFFPAGDSAMAFRFVNLSKHSGPVSVNIRGLSNGSEITGLGYKSVTAFKRYDISLLMNDYVFEFRDAASGALLANYTTLGLQQPTPNNWVFRSFTLVFTGEPGATGSLAPIAFLVGHN